MAAFGNIERRYHLANPWSQPSFAENGEVPPAIGEEELARIFAPLENRPGAVFPWRLLFESRAKPASAAASSPASPGATSIGGTGRPTS